MIERGIGASCSDSRAAVDPERQRRAAPPPAAPFDCLPPSCDTCAMRLAERVALGVALAAAAVQFVAGRYVPELDRDFPRMSPIQSAWLLGVPFAIIAAIVLTRRWAPSERVRYRLTVAVAVAAVGAVAYYLLFSGGG